MRWTTSHTISFVLALVLVIVGFALIFSPYGNRYLGVLFVIIGCAVVTACLTVSDD